MKIIGALALSSFALGALIGGLGSIENAHASRSWQPSQPVERAWVDEPLRVIVESGRWQVSEDLFADSDQEVGAVSAKLVAVVLNSEPYALIQQNQEGALVVNKVNVDDELGDWQVENIDEVCVHLVHGEEKHVLTLFEGVNDD
ncbi:MAG: hypothetical protein JJ934_16685 [Pseudomonadales bacterium]|nr:hypothetical protein [Pseudomonadales bacterium]